MRALDLIYATLARPEVMAHDWAVEGFGLGGRLLERFTPRADEVGLDDLLEEPEAPAPSPHPLGRPARLVQALLEGEIPVEWLHGFGEHPLELRALSAACTQRRVSWPRMAHALWKSWQRGGCPEGAELPFAPAGPYRDRLWPHLPAEVLAAAWPRWVAADVPWPFECFGASQWSAFVELFGERWRRAPSSAIWRAAFERMELAHLERAIEIGQLLAAESGASAEALLARACRRYPAWTCKALRERIASGDATAVALLLGAAPRELDEELVRALSDELSRRSTERAVIDVSRAWLHALLAQRRAAFGSAYTLFVELEARLARARVARGD